MLKILIEIMTNQNPFLNKKNLLLLTVIILASGLLFKSLTMISSPQIETSPQAETSLPFEPEKINVEAKSVFPLAIRINSGQNLLAGVEIWLTFDPELLELASIIPADFFSSSAVINQKIDNQSGQASFVLLCPPQNPKQGEGNLALLNFKTKLAGQNQTKAVEFLPQTKVSAIGEGQNVLKKTAKAIINFSQ